MLRSQTNKSFLAVFLLIGLTFFSGLILSSSFASAEDDTVIDNINISIPSACTMYGDGTYSHTATINNGTYATDIGTTTIQAFCNDSDGFAIYAIGYTDDTDGKNVMSGNVGSDYDIQTGTGTSGNSQWAMKLATNSEATYPLTLQNGYGSYHIIPDDYELVAKRTSNTDVGQGAVGSILTSTYQVFISNNQPAGTYIGQVKYVMVHPHNTDTPVREDQIAVSFNGNGLTFPDGTTNNKVIYSNSCAPMYVGVTPQIVETSNLSNGVQSGAYTDNEYVFQTKSFDGASKIKVEVDYGITGGTIEFAALDGGWDGDWDSWDNNWNDNWIYSDSNSSGTRTYIFYGNTVTIYSDSWNTPETDYSYGFYAKVYPIYTTEQVNTEETIVCGYEPQNGSYAQTTTWNGKWYAEINNEIIMFEDEASIIRYISINDSYLLGTTIELYAYYPYKVFYNGNGATSGTMDGFYTPILTNTSNDSVDLMAYNYRKIGYGFAGWSVDPNASVNSASKIYGPNETIGIEELAFDNNRETTLYAVWVPSAGNIQDWSGCSGISIGQVTALTDVRDNNVYAVGKLADGNCWMMENLRLDAPNSSDSTKAQGFGGVFVGLANSEDTTFGTTMANSLYSTSNITGSYQNQRFPRYNNNNTNIGGSNSSSVALIVSPGLWNGAYDDPQQRANGANGDHYQWYGYGNYYSWAAAMANTSSLVSTTATETTNTSICPKGWLLPYGNTSGNGATAGGFSYLDIQLGGTGGAQYTNSASNRWRSYPNNYIYSGMWNQENGMARMRGEAGYYWSRTGGANDIANLSINSYGLDMSAAFQKLHGAAIRCYTE